MAKRNYDKKPLYRKFNRRTHSLCSMDRGGPEFRWQRNSKAEKKNKSISRGMAKDRQHGLDYTPLYQFLLSKVGADWDDVYREAVSRLPNDSHRDRDEPIYRIVARLPKDKRDYVWVDENTAFSGLYVDDENRLVKVAPDFGVEGVEPWCPCHTHTFNGAIVTNPCENPIFLDQGQDKE